MSCESDVLFELNGSSFSLLSKPEGIPYLSAEVVLRDDLREIFVRLYDVCALMSLQSPKNLGIKPQWSLIRDNPSGYWSRGPTGKLVFTHANGTFEEQVDEVTWHEVQSGIVYSQYKCIQKKIISEDMSKV